MSALSPIRSASVLIPTFRGALFLERVLAALASQETRLAWDVLALDSGSDDGTLEILERAARDFPVPFRVGRIHPLEFDHGDTRNELAARSTGDLLVYLTQDAIPSGSSWLATLASNFEAPDVGAAYCRNVPRPDARPTTARLAEADPGYQAGRREVRLPPPDEYRALGPDQRRLLYNFNDVASALRRELWERHPFPRTWFGEDVLMARALLEAGYTVVYDDRATVEHSHDYDAGETLERARIDGRFNAEWLGRVCIASRSDADALARRLAVDDAAALGAGGHAPGALAELLRELDELRRATFVGLFEGGRTAHRRPPTRMHSGAPLHVLYVVHGFPPETWAGTEVYTLQLAQEIQALGHRVTVLCRSAAGSGAEGVPEYSLAEDDFQGVRVVRMTHRLDFEGMRESYENPVVERVFARLLERERPDLVHFQHLIHFSAGLVEVARARGLATVVTCNDYWALCARVQLIRPDGVRCPENMGLGCLVCVKEKDYGKIESARRWFPLAEPLVLAGGGLAVRLMQPPSVKLTRFFQDARVLLRRRLRSWRDVRDRQDYVLGMYARADLLVGPSRFLRQKLLDTGHFDPHRFVYSDYGLRLGRAQAARRQPDPEGRVRLGFIGSLVWYKGIEVLLEAMRRLAGSGVPGSGVPGAGVGASGRPGSGVVLAVHGDFRPESDPYHARLAERAEGAPVEFRGRFSNEELPEVYRAIDVLVVPSVWYENSPITIHEAFAFETPVVTSDIGGMAELVGDGVNGLHFRAGDADSLALVLARLAEEPELLPSLQGRFPRVKSIEENAREMEYRYRALVCVERPWHEVRSDGKAAES